MLAEGGNGGWGNQRFKTSTNRAPRKANQGEKGVELTLWLRLKLLADIGLVGKPNVGKSSILSTITNAKPKIGDFPDMTGVFDIDANSKSHNVTMLERGNVGSI